MQNAEKLQKTIERALRIYDISRDGTIINKETGKLVKGSIIKGGYRSISVYLPETAKTKKITIHRLVALKHIPNPENLPQVNHKDGNRLNNHADNLEWCTPSYNVQDGFKRGRVTWNDGAVSKSRVLNFAKRYPRQLFWFITTDDFRRAKALWGEHKDAEHYQHTAKASRSDWVNTFHQAGVAHTKADSDKFLKENYYCGRCTRQFKGDYDLNHTTCLLKSPANIGWQYHLQQMVIATNPVEYLEDHCNAA